MALAYQRNWNKPQEYVLKQDKKRRTRKYKESLSILKCIFPYIKWTLQNIDALEDWKIIQIIPLYEEIGRIFHKFRGIKDLSYLLSFCPPIPPRITVNTKHPDIDDSHIYWEDITSFNDLLYKLNSSKNMKITIPDNLQRLIKNYNSLLQDEDIKNINDIIGEYKGESELVVNTTEGEVEYISPEGKVYKAKFAKGSNCFKLLELLAEQPFENFNYKDIEANFKESRGDSTPDRRVRDAVAYIRKKLALSSEVDFLKADYGYSLGCKVRKITGEK